MGNEIKKFDTQEILNQSSDQDVAPVLIQVGNKVWNGAGWDKAGPGGLAADSAVKFAAIDFNSSGDNTLVAAVTLKKIRVISLFLVSAGTVNIRFESDASGSPLTGQMNLIANTGFVLPFNPGGWFETVAGELLNLELSAGISVDGSLSYIEAD
jgi:hypothetical protein